MFPFFKKRNKGMNYHEAINAVIDEARAQKGYTVVDLVRKQLKGFDPKQLDNSDDVELLYMSENDESEGLDVFLAHCRDLRENPAFDPIMESLIRNQILFIAMESESNEETNFGRATINGLQLFRDELDRLVGIYKERHAKEEDFDPHDIT